MHLPSSWSLYILLSPGCDSEGFCIHAIPSGMNFFRSYPKCYFSSQHLRPAGVPNLYQPRFGLQWYLRPVLGGLLSSTSLNLKHEKHYCDDKTL